MNYYRLVMQTSSPYFNSLLSLKLKETQENCIEYNHVSSNVFEQLLNYVYTGAVKADETNICDIIIAADYFGFYEISDYYCQYLCENLNDYNPIGMLVSHLFAVSFCSHKRSGLDVLQFLTTYSFHTHALRVKQYLCRNFSRLTDDVLLEIDFHLFYSLLTSNELYVNSEFEIFDRIIQWLSYDYANRRSHTKRLLSLLKISCIKSVKLFNYINGIECEELKIAIGNCLYEKFNEFNDDSRGVKIIEEARKYLRKSILVFGGISDTSRNTRLNTRVFCFDTVNLQLYSLASSFQTRSNHCVCEFNDLVFIAGGEVNLCISDLVEIYDLDYFRDLIKDGGGEAERRQPALNVPTQMIQSRTDFGMCTVDDRLYVFGGWIGSDVGNTIEYYTPIENRWIRVASTLPTLRYEFACVALPNSTFIYLIGGTSAFETKLALVERFDIGSHTWQTCASMHEKRSGCSVVVLNEHIYALGGYNGRSVLNSVEVYDPLNDRWQPVVSMNYARYGCVASSIDDRIYVLGGVSSMITKELVIQIEYYDPISDRWFELDDKNLSLGIFKAAVVNI